MPDQEMVVDKGTGEIIATSIVRPARHKDYVASQEEAKALKQFESLEDQIFAGRTDEVRGKAQQFLALYLTTNTTYYDPARKRELYLFQLFHENITDYLSEMDKAGIPYADSSTYYVLAKFYKKWISANSDPLLVANLICEKLEALRLLEDGGAIEFTNTSNKDGQQAEYQATITDKGKEILGEATLGEYLTEINASNPRRATTNVSRDVGRVTMSFESLWHPTTSHRLFNVDGKTRLEGTVKLSTPRGDFLINAILFLDDTDSTGARLQGQTTNQLLQTVGRKLKNSFVL